MYILVLRGADTRGEPEELNGEQGQEVSLGEVLAAVVSTYLPPSQTISTGQGNE